MAHQMPAIFFGHGNPLNALLKNEYTKGWAAIGASIPRPQAILSISAHWYLPGTAVTEVRRPRTIHDFGGFPQELYQVNYPAPGHPELARRVQQLLAPTKVQLDQEWGLDHGTWSVLIHVFPNADVPVVQLSIDETATPKFHYQLANRLAPLRDEGVLIIGSGNIVHNLRLIDRSRVDVGFDWSERFDDAVNEALVHAPGEILRVTSHRDYWLAVPTPDHFIPLLYIAGLATEDEPARALVRGYALGSLSMSCYSVGAVEQANVGGSPAATIPQGIRADDTNT